MKHMRTILSLMLAVLFMFCTAFAQEGSTPLSYTKGDKIKDFSFTTYEGNTYTLYDILQEKDAVLLNIWATWCGPCRSEFPYMQEAYEAYQDRVEIIALSCEPTDTTAKLANFAKQYGLTFKVGQDPIDFLSALGMSSIPTTLMIDRFGTICFVEAGAQPDADSFKRLFDAFLGEEYTESILLDAIPPVKPDVAASSEADLTAALGAAAKNPTDVYIWPMVVTEKDGRSVVASTNSTYPSTRAEVSATVNARNGDAIEVTFKTSTELVFDVFTISVNGKTVKSFSGENDWMTYTIPVEADGEYNVQLTYSKDYVGNNGMDTVWVDSIAVVSNAGEPDVAIKAAEYTFKCVDQTGKPVPGVMLQICDAETCQVLKTDESGLCRFSGAPYAWEVHILRAPAGYAADSTEVVYAPVNGGEIVLTLTAN